jgi:hypothetical protein
LSLAGIAHLGDEFVEVSIRLSECILSFHLSTKRHLKKLGRREIALFELIMEVVGEVHLNAWHTPNYTPMLDARPAHIAAPHDTTAPLWIGTDAIGQVLGNVRVVR